MFLSLVNCTHCPLHRKCKVHTLLPDCVHFTVCAKYIFSCFSKVCAVYFLPIIEWWLANFTLNVRFRRWLRSRRRRGLRGPNLWRQCRWHGSQRAGRHSPFRKILDTGWLCNSWRRRLESSTRPQKRFDHWDCQLCLTEYRFLDSTKHSSLLLGIFSSILLRELRRDIGRWERGSFGPCHGFESGVGIVSLQSVGKKSEIEDIRLSVELNCVIGLG